jgi:ubiquinone/menaquinone biosynthesis C-methylase UbiE
MIDDTTAHKTRVRNRFNFVAAANDVGTGCFSYFGRELVAAAGIGPGQRVLDVASGRGAVLFPCTERLGGTGDLVGIDLSEEMARVTSAEAARLGIAARVLVMDAEHLDFADAVFDRVLCGFGIMFFPDQLHALSEFRRVLKPGGLLAVSTWRVSQTSELQAVMAELDMDKAPVPGWITEPDVLAGLLSEAGFKGVSVEANSHAFSYADVDEYWRQARGTGLRRTLDSLSDADAARLLEALRQRVAPGPDKHFNSTSTALIGIGLR